VQAARDGAFKASVAEEAAAAEAKAATARVAAEEVRERCFAQSFPVHRSSMCT